MSASRDMLRLARRPFELTPKCWPGNELEGLCAGLPEAVLKRVGVWDRIDESCGVMELIVTVNSSSSGG